ncbi:flavodoxin family protein [Methanoplanus endosymbiosus]|uniref:Flavodoxin-like domain-containing protein n=1 Tax=Methanoplanus endosymbiosus TaxID=33865 RepID=A0A9E7PPD7_9EURY|nr:hypothetical protein [Methanoplanus endosymbiosus]UUX91192.1 hypothetical protein L6E24_07310 [Methanoplanus endosymbiosus]
MKILTFCFSATGNTAKIADVIEKKLTLPGAEVHKTDITTHKARKKETDLKPYDAFVFGFPEYSWRAPKEAGE